MGKLLSLSTIALAAAGLGGCFLVPAPEPFTQSIAARPLDPSALIVSPPPSLPGTPAPAPAEPPERTDMTGAGDGSMELDRVLIRASSIQQRAPDYSSEQTAAMICGSMKAGFSIDGARRMHAATLKAEQARLDYDAERITGKQLDEAERARQDAVINYLLPVPVLNWMITPAEKKNDLPAPVFGDVTLLDTDLFTFNENGRNVTAVSGIVRNSGKTTVQLPPLTLRAIDAWDYTIAGQSSLLPFASLGAGEARPFEVRFLNPPANTAEVYLHFAPPFLYRTRRDCDFFDPASFDPAASLSVAPMMPAPPPDGEYAAGELNQLTLFFRRESEAAWLCQTAGRCDAAQSAERINWRDMFLLAEASDEAWIAASAAEAARARSSVEIEQADTARKAAMLRVRSLGSQALTRAGSNVPDIDVAVTQSTFGRDAAGLFVEIAGTLTNTGTKERRIDSIMVAFVDRLELPLSTVALKVNLVLPPGTSRTFGRRLEAGATRGTDGVQMAWGEKREAAPARIPPRDIPWRVRVGAMARAAPAAGD